MALGGGSFLTQNKVLSGSYINFVSVANSSSSLSDRGYATMPLELDFGIENDVFTVTNADFQKKSQEIFGYDYTHSKLKNLRDLFLNVNVLYAYRLNSGGVNASNLYATAKYCGIRGNNISISIVTNADDETAFDVITELDFKEVSVQTVTEIESLLDNEYVTFNKDTFVLEQCAGILLTGGENGEVTGASHQNYLDKIEKYTFNTMGVCVTDDITKSLYTSFCKRLRDEVGAKFQVVLHKCSADYEGVISVENDVTDDENIASLVYWSVGANASCMVNKSLLNKVYDGEYSVNTNYTQQQLAQLINKGFFAFHLVSDEVRVLSDINTLVNTTDDKGEIFKENQTIRVCDQIANDIAVIFNTKYLGVIPNDNAGRISLWNDIVNHHNQLQDIRAIEDFASEDVSVTKGDSKKSVVVTDVITVVNAMAKLYMTVKVS